MQDEIRSVRGLRREAQAAGYRVDELRLQFGPDAEFRVVIDVLDLVFEGRLQIPRFFSVRFRDEQSVSSDIGELPPALVEDTARRTDTVVYAVSAGIPKRVRFLDELTRLTGGSLIAVDARADLGPTFLRILEEFRQRYLLSYSPRGVARGGWHDITVRLPGRDASIQARPGYLSGS